MLYTLPKTNSSPLKVSHPESKVLLQVSIISGKLLVSGRVSLTVPYFIWELVENQHLFLGTLYFVRVPSYLPQC